MKKFLKKSAILVFFGIAFAGFESCKQNEKDSEPSEMPAQPEKTYDEINQARDRDLDIYIFNRHRFADLNENFTGYDDEKSLKWGKQRFWEAQAFMQKKIDAFNKMVANDPNAGWLLSTQSTPGYLVENLSTHTTNSIGVTVGKNIKDFAKFMAQIQYNFVKDNNPQDYWQFCTCYDKLAVRAYNDSLGDEQNNFDLPTFQKDEPNINQELAEYGITTDPNDYHTVENTMQSLLKQVANRTHCNYATLQATIEIALYNEGIYGLADLGGKAYVTGDQIYKPPKYSGYDPDPRERLMFNSHMDSELNAIKLAAKVTEQQNNLARQLPLAQQIKTLGKAFFICQQGAPTPMGMIQFFRLIQHTFYHL